VAAAQRLGDEVTQRAVEVGVAPRLTAGTAGGVLRRVVDAIYLIGECFRDTR
jgi:hypothetical protein